MLGEVFADPHISEKFEMLEAEPRIEGYSFYSNFILARSSQTGTLPGLRKLASMYISLYGFDEDSFELTTKKPASQFDQLLENLFRLLKIKNDWHPPIGINFNVRTVKTGIPFLERDTPIAEF